MVSLKKFIILSIFSLVFGQNNNDFGYKIMKNNKGTNIKFVGKAPKIKIFPSINEGESNGFLMLSMNKLLEVTSDNQITTNRIDSFASQHNINFYGPYIDNETNKTTVYFAGTPNRFENTNINISVSSYQNSENILYGSKFLIAPELSIKWSIEIDNWPFINNSNYLQFIIDLDYSTKNKSKNINKINNDVNIDTGIVKSIINLPDYVMINGNEQLFNITYTNDNIYFNFPSFSYMYYDPIITQTSKGFINTFSPLLIIFLYIITYMSLV